MFGVKTDTLRRGEYTNYTFRLPTHVPELTFSINAERGCVCLYASNCAERPLPRMCQWTLLVDADEAQSGTLTVRTSEHHFVSGLYHVGLYCVADSSFSLACFPAQKDASPEVLKAMAAEQRRAGGFLAPTGHLSHRRPARSPAEKRWLRSETTPTGVSSMASPARATMASMASPARATKKPFIDEGILEASLSARARAPKPVAIGAPVASAFAASSVGTAAARAAAPASGWRAAARGGGMGRSEWVDPGEMHHDHVLGEWHRSLRGAIEDTTQLPPSAGALASGALAYASPRSHASPRRGMPVSAAHPVAKLGSTLDEVVASWNGADSRPTAGSARSPPHQPLAPAAGAPLAPPPAPKPPLMALGRSHMHGMTPSWIGGTYS